MVFETGANEWKDYEAFPPKEATATSFFLTENNKLSNTNPSVSKSYDEYVSDPQKPVPYTEDVHLMRTREYMTDDQRFASRRPDVLVYQTDILTEDFTVSGKIGVDLFVSTTGTDADFIVKVIDVFPDNQKKWSNSTVPMTGYQMLLRGEPFRGRFRESFEHPIPFKPKKVAEIKFDMPAIAHTFKRGHRLMIQVQSTWFPLVDRNPQQFIDIYNAKDEDYKKATQRIYHDKKHPSHINLMLIK
jgi:putative CocE/NonD family hydrolase